MELKWQIDLHYYYGFFNISRRTLKTELCCGPFKCEKYQKNLDN